MTDLPPLTAFGELIDPSNPVVFIDVASEAAFGKSKPPPEEKGRITIELFAHWSPKMATNVLQLCTGEARKANNPASGPVGYKGSFLYGSVPGREVTGGDVLRGNGTGMPFSIYEGNGPFAADTVTPNATKKTKLNSYPGLVRMVPTTMGTISPDGAPNVGCSFSISCIPPAEMPQTWLEGHWSTVIGRVVGRPGTQDMAHTMALIERCAKDIYTSRRNPNKASESSGLPIVEQCGEM